MALLHLPCRRREHALWPLLPAACTTSQHTSSLRTAPHAPAQKAVKQAKYKRIEFIEEKAGRKEEEKTETPEKKEAREEKKRRKEEKKMKPRLKMMR